MLVVTCVSLLPSGLGTRLGDMVCCVPSELDFEAADSSVVRYRLSNYSLRRSSSCCKYDMDALSWLNSDTLERAPTPLFSGLVRCSAYECSFTRLNSQHTCSGELSLVLYLLLYLDNTHTVY